MSRTLFEKHCQPCTIGTRAMLPEDANKMLTAIPRWKKINVDGMEQIRREFHFPDFKQAAAFTHKIGLIAEREDHHPSLLLESDRDTRHRCRRTRPRGPHRHGALGRGFMER